MGSSCCIGRDNGESDISSSWPAAAEIEIHGWNLERQYAAFDFLQEAIDDMEVELDLKTELQDMMAKAPVKPRPGPVLTACIEGDNVSLTMLTGDRACADMTVPAASWMSMRRVAPLSFIQFRRMATESITARGGRILCLRNGHADDGQPIGDADDITLMKRLTIYTMEQFKAGSAAPDSARIEHRLRTSVMDHNSLPYKRLIRSARDFVTAMAWADGNKEQFLKNLDLLYAELGGPLDVDMRSQFLSSFYKGGAPRADIRGGPRPRRRPR